MPQYYFHLYDDIVSQDDEGIELADQAAAENYAVMCARDMAAAQARQGRLTLSHRIEVTDDQGSVLKTVQFCDAVAVLP
jgi:hypothetical protein